MKINIFTVDTEYQLLKTLSLIDFNYSSNEYQNFVFVFKSQNRLIKELNYDKFSNIKFQMEVYGEFDNLFKFIISRKIDNYFFSQENNIFYKYGAYLAKKKNAKIILTSDGLKSLANFKKKNELMIMVIETLTDYKKLLKLRYIMLEIHFSFNYKYGYFKLIDEIWVEDKTNFKVKSWHKNKKINQYPQISEDTISKLTSFFIADKVIELNLDNLILYINQPYLYQDVIELEISLLKEINTKFPEKRFIVKLHPFTSIDTINLYKQLDFLELQFDTFPVELYLVHLKNSIVFSGWSTALLFYCNQNRYYSLYYIYKKLNNPVLAQFELPKFPHINYVNNIEEFRF